MRFLTVASFLIPLSLLGQDGPALDLDETVVEGTIQKPQADFFLQSAEVEFTQDLGFDVSYNLTELIVDSVNSDVF